MKQVKLGSQGLMVSRLGLGCMGMSQWYGEPDDVESERTLHKAIELGVNFFDSAEAYGPFTNEVLIGKALKGFRDKAVIATKFGFDLQDGKIVGGRPRKLSATPDLSGTVLPLCPIPNSASKSAPSFNSVKLKASASAALLA